MRPKLICMTPVKNEAWVLNIFLKCASLWADHIIVADQNSTDGSQDIARRYPKVLLIENKGQQYDEAQRQKMLIDEARKIEGPKILFALDADEILTANYLHTGDWQRILNSTPGEVFGFQWANITTDRKRYFPSSFYYPWLINDDGVVEHKNYARTMHSMRIPYPKEADKGYYEVNDFKVFHLALLNPRKSKSKTRFYECLENLNKVSNPISCFRSYGPKGNVKEFPIPDEWFNDYKVQSIDIYGELNLNERFFWFDMGVIDLFKKHGFEKFRNLDIWDKEWITEMKEYMVIKDPRNAITKLMHFSIYDQRSPYIRTWSLEVLIKY